MATKVFLRENSHSHWSSLVLIDGVEVSLRIGTKFLASYPDDDGYKDILVKVVNFYDGSFVVERVDRDDQINEIIDD